MRPRPASSARDECGRPPSRVLCAPRSPRSWLRPAQPVSPWIGSVSRKLTQAVSAVLAVVPGPLVAAEGRIEGDRCPVDVHGAGAQPAGDSARTILVGRRGDPGRPVAGVVGDADGVVLVLVADQREDRSEDLLPGDGHAVVHVGEDGRSDEEALVHVLGPSPSYARAHGARPGGDDPQSGGQVGPGSPVQQPLVCGSRSSCPLLRPADDPRPLHRGRVPDAGRHVGRRPDTRRQHPRRDAPVREALGAGADGRSPGPQYFYGSERRPAVVRSGPQPIERRGPP